MSALLPFSDVARRLVGRGPHAMGLAAALGNQHPLLADANTVFLGRGWNWNDFSGLAVDRSLRGASLGTVVAGSRAHGTVPTLGTSGTITALVRLATPTDDSTDRWALSQNDGSSLKASFSWRFGLFRHLTNGSITFGLNLTPPDLSSTPSVYIWQRTWRPNPNTTRSSDAILSTVRAWNTTTGGYAEVSAAHAAFESATTLIIGAANTSGGSPFLGDAAAQAGIKDVRIENVYRDRAAVERTLPLLRSWPAPQLLSTLQDGLVFAPRLSDLYDPISGLQGVEAGTDPVIPYDAATRSRDFDATEWLAWPSVADVTARAGGVAMWAKITSVSSIRGLFAVGSGDGRILYAHTDGSLRFFENRDGGGSVDRVRYSAASAAVVGQWAHYAATWDDTDAGAGVSLYRNGLELSYASTGNGSGTPRTLDGEWRLGWMSVGTMLGPIAELAAVWDGRKPSAAEVYNLFQMTGPR